MQDLSIAGGGSDARALRRQLIAQQLLRPQRPVGGPQTPPLPPHFGSAPGLANLAANLLGGFNDARERAAESARQDAMVERLTGEERAARSAAVEGVRRLGLDAPAMPAAAAAGDPPGAGGDPRAEPGFDAVAGSRARLAANPAGPQEIPGGYRANPGVGGAFAGAPPPSGVVNAAIGGAAPPAPAGAEALFAEAARLGQAAALMRDADPAAAAMFQARAAEASRRAQALENAAQRRETMEFQARLAAANRPAPAPEPLVEVERDGRGVLVPRSQAVGASPFRPERPEARGSQAERDEATLLRGDPAAPEYAMAFNRAFGERVTTDASGNAVVVRPAVPPGIRPPTFGAPPAAAPAEVPSAPTSAPTPPAGATTQTPGGGTVSVLPTPAPRAAAVPSGFERRDDGGLRPIPGGPQDPVTQPLNETQSRSNMFGRAMEMGDETLRTVRVPSAGALFAWRNLPEGPVNMALSENDQRYFNALRSFAAGVLRKETGAAFGREELLDVQSRFFPMPGDSAATIAQKARAREEAIASMRAEVPGGFRRGDAPAAAAPAGRPRVATPADAARLPPGTEYETPDGRVFRR